jgi:hypothetical protein
MRRMVTMKSRAAAFGLAVLALGASGSAHAGAAVADSSAYGGYLQQLATEVTAYTGTADAGGALAPRSIALGGDNDLSGLAAADQALVRAMTRTHDLFRALGGTNDRSAVVERSDGKVYVGLDGEGGRWFADAASAAAFLLSELVDTSADVSDSVRDAVGAATVDAGCGVACVTEVAFKELIKLIAYVPRGTTVSLTLSSNGFSDDDGEPVVEVPDGFVVHNVTYVDASSVVAKVSVTATATTGRAVLSAFNAGQAFRAVDSFAVQVVDSVEQLDGDQTAPTLPGSGTIEALDDDHADSFAGATTLAAAASGRLETSGDTDTFKVVVDEPGTFTVSSSGGTDVTLTLKDADGKTLVGDDDGGNWYNASLSRAVVVGTYYVTVGHCCGGTGAYSLGATLE